MKHDKQNQRDKLLHVQHMEQVDYEVAWELQKKLVTLIVAGERTDTLLLLEHPPTYTIGSQRESTHLLLSKEELERKQIAVYEIDRGGDITYHGPGQLVGYPLLLLEGPQLDLHHYLRTLEEVIIQYLENLGVNATRKAEYTGVWVGDEKIAAIGVKFNKCRRRRGFVTSHGFAFNVKRGIEQEGFAHIIPCGIRQFGVTSLEACTGRSFTVQQVGERLLPYFVQQFGFTALRVETMLK